jgi:hypothetical protein
MVKEKKFTLDPKEIELVTLNSAYEGKYKCTTEHGGKSR